MDAAGAAETRFFVAALSLPSMATLPVDSMEVAGAAVVAVVVVVSSTTVILGVCSRTLVVLRRPQLVRSNEEDAVDVCSDR